MPERKYAMRRLGCGLYLLRGNDESLWLIRRYQDGPTYGLDIPRDAWFWDLHRWNGKGNPSREEIDDGTLQHWVCVEQMKATRRECIAVVVEQTTADPASSTPEAQR